MTAEGAKIDANCIAYDGQLLQLCCSPVEENTEFLEDLRKASNGKGVILMCEAGGTTKPSPNFAAGKASRSLKVRPSKQHILPVTAVLAV